MKPLCGLFTIALLLAGCVASDEYQTEGERMDDAAREISAGIDTTGLEALQ